MKSDFFLDQEFIKKIVSEKSVKALFLNSPNNPSGHIWTKDELSFVKDLIQDNGIMIIAMKSIMNICTSTAASVLY